MLKRFTSNFTNKVDAKGRVSLPASFRKVLDARAANGMFYLVPGFRQKGCLEGYPEDVFNVFADGIERMHPADPERLKLERRVISRAEKVTLDENGRIPMPANFRRRFPAGCEAVFVGMNDRFELWEAEAYEDFLDAEDDEDGNPLAGLPWPAADAPSGPEGGE